MFRLHSLGASTIYTHYLLDINGEKVLSATNSAAIALQSYSSKNVLPKIPLPIEEKKVCLAGIYTIYGSPFCFTPKAKALVASEATPATIVPGDAPAETLTEVDDLAARQAAIKAREKKQLLIAGGIVALVAVGGVIAYQVSKK